jgi:DnaJ-class molecular chaperone
MPKTVSDTTRRVLSGSMTCKECDGRCEVSVGERHGFHETSLCPVCKGNGVVPIWKEVRQRAEEISNVAS